MGSPVTMEEALYSLMDMEDRIMNMTRADPYFVRPQIPDWVSCNQDKICEHTG